MEAIHEAPKLQEVLLLIVLFFAFFVFLVRLTKGKKLTSPTPVELEDLNNGKHCTYTLQAGKSDIELAIVRSELQDNYDDEDEDEDDDGDDIEDPTQIQANSSNGNTALHVAVLAEKVQVAYDLIKKKPKSAYYPNNQGISPLHLAVDAGLDHTVEYMFKKCPGNKLSKPTIQQLVGSQNAFLAHSAIYQRKFQMFQLLLDNLPSLVKSQDKRGWKPLSVVAYKGYVDQVSFLLSRFPGCAKKRDGDGSFPIHKAASGGHISVIAEFLSRCPETMFQKDRKQRTILDVALQYNKPQVFKYLKQEHGDEFKNMLDQLKRG